MVHYAQDLTYDCRIIGFTAGQKMPRAIIKMDTDSTTILLALHGPTSNAIMQITVQSNTQTHGHVHASQVFRRPKTRVAPQYMHA